MMDETLKTSWHTEDDKVVVKRSQDVQSILDHNKELQIDGPNRRSDMRHVGSIPFIVLEMWLRESNLTLGSKEFAEYVKKKLLSGEYNKLLIHGY
jgi:hypothetical protein